MQAAEVSRRLEDARDSGNFIAKAQALTEELEHDPDGFAAIYPILRFIEANPHLDFGTPGPLVHFVERFYGRGYEAKLMESIGRCPTLSTVWMLNRVLNGTRHPGERARLRSVLSGVAESPTTDPQPRQLARHFLDRDAGRG